MTEVWRGDVLGAAAELIAGDRDEQYGPAIESLGRIGRLWAEVLGVGVAPHQVALCMTLVKVSRLAYEPRNVDSWVDAAGYVALGAELAGDA